MKANIDMDIVLYRCSAGSSYVSKASIAEARAEGRPDPQPLTLEQCIDLLPPYVDRILENVDATEFKLYCTPSGKDKNFRYKLYPEYKGTRTGEKPKHYYALQDYAAQFYGPHFEFATFAEADDMLSCNQDANSIACTIDKDMNQFTGKHYHLVSSNIKEIDDVTAWYSLWSQMLTGDREDNIISPIYRCGKATAKKILDPLLPEEYMDTVRELYNDDRLFTINYNMVHLWEFPWQLYDGEAWNTYENEETFRKALDELCVSMGI